MLYFALTINFLGILAIISPLVNNIQALPLSITQGIASGDVTAHTAVIWSRANKEALMNVQYDTDPIFSHPEYKTTIADSSTNFAGKLKLEHLMPNSQYYYRVWFSGDTSNISNVMIGTFQTAPTPLETRPIDFVFGGDLGGQGFCRRYDSGYSEFSKMRALNPIFFLFVCDQIYADSSCTKKGPNHGPYWQNIEANMSSVVNSSVNWTGVPQLYNTS